MTACSSETPSFDDHRTVKTVCKSMAEAANSILNNSYALIELKDDATTSAIHQAWQEALHFFKTAEDGPANFPALTVIEDGHLLGFNKPSPAKILFRSFSKRSRQPWPSSSFMEKSLTVAANLHDILTNILRIIVADAESSSDSTTPRKRKIKDDLFEIHMNECPLDYFYYHNRQPNAINCSEHIDRGVLICVCLTQVSGLELLPTHGTNFICPESQLEKKNSHDKTSGASTKFICVMAGDSLKSYNRRARPCLHRVKNDLTEPRLSISYELRQATSKEKDIKIT